MFYLSQIKIQLPKLRVAGSNPVCRSKYKALKISDLKLIFNAFIHPYTYTLTRKKSYRECGFRHSRIRLRTAAQLTDRQQPGQQPRQQPIQPTNQSTDRSTN